MIIKQHDLMNTDLWNVLSLKKSNGSYNQDNKSCIESISDKEIYGIGTLYKTVSKYANTTYKPPHNIPSHTVSYIESNFKDSAYIIDCITSETKKLIGIGDNLKLDCYNGYVIKNQKCVMNIFLDTIKPQITNTFIKTDNIIETADKLDEFIHRNNSIFILKSKWGTGKTHHIIKMSYNSTKEKAYQ